jgi:hypothetical protein
MGERTRNSRIAFAAALAAAAATLAGALAADRGAAQFGDRASVVGQTANTPKPVCPTPEIDNPPADRACNVLGRVTGFQTRADGRKNLFKVRKPGKIVAWSVALGRPDKEEQEFFLTQLSKSGPPSARLSILKPKGDARFKLTKQSPVVQLKPYFGEQPIFTLSDPLRVKKGVIVAITTPTWIPNLALRGASQSDRWRASRPKGECDGEDALLQQSRPQQKVGGQRPYECSYRATRVLYTAFLDARKSN